MLNSSKLSASLSSQLQLSSSSQEHRPALSNECHHGPSGKQPNGYMVVRSWAREGVVWTLENLWQIHPIEKTNYLLVGRCINHGTICNSTGSVVSYSQGTEILWQVFREIKCQNKVSLMQYVICTGTISNSSAFFWKSRLYVPGCCVLLCSLMNTMTVLG